MKKEENNISKVRALLSIVISVVVVLGMVGGLYVKVNAVDSLRIDVDTLETRVDTIEKAQIKMQADIEFIKENSKEAKETSKEILKLLRSK